MKRIGIVAAVLAVLGFGGGYGINRVAAHFLTPEEALEELQIAKEGDEEPAARPAPAAVAKPLKGMLESILRNNAFDPVAALAWQPKSGDGGGPIVTDLRVKLLGTIVAVPSAFSSALILDEGTSSSRGYGLGDKVHDAEVIRIEAKKVTIRRGDGSEEVLELGDSQMPKASTPSGTPAEGPEEGISKVSDTEFTISRDTFNKYISDLEKLSGLGRGLLHRGPDGSFDGYRLTAIRRNSIAEQLGIQNGDVIHTVNGQPLNSVQSAMNAYSSMSSAAQFQFEVTRRGEKTNLTYNIQ